MSSSFKQDKPEDCIVCTEKLGEEEKVLECGHWVHLLCIQKHFKPECPICRKPLNITVNGTIPRPEENNDIDNNDIDNNDIQEININIHIHGINIPNVIERGFTYEINNIIFIEEHYYEDENEENSRDDDSDSDEENPRGDNFDYDDY